MPVRVATRRVRLRVTSPQVTWPRRRTGGTWEGEWSVGPLRDLGGSYTLVRTIWVWDPLFLDVAVMVITVRSSEMVPV